MESSQLKHKKKRDHKPLIILLIGFLFFAVFVYFITRPSIQNKAIEELASSFNKKDVEMVWYKYKAALYQDEKFLFEVRKKLTSFDMTEKEAEECRSWLPPAPTSINLIVVPDLSRRIIDTLNNPDQVDNDLKALKAIWDSFKNYSKLKQDTKDKLIVDVTDIDQAKGQFGKVANSLQYDLTAHKGKSNRLYFTSDKDRQFDSAVKNMYALAIEKPLGADYRSYFNRYLKDRLMKPTFFDNYINKIIIITDGYMEAEDKPADTKIYKFQKILYDAVENGTLRSIVSPDRLHIPTVDIDLSGCDVLVCEVNERRAGKNYDYDILKAYWDDWLNGMNAKIKFVKREQATNLTRQRIENFIIE